MDNKNHFSDKFEQKSSEELVTIIDNNDYQKDAQLAALWELEKRNIHIDAQVAKELTQEKKQTKTSASGRFSGIHFFNQNQASVSAALAGPIPAGILIYLNYKKFGKDKEAYITLGTTLILTFLLFFMLLKIPEEILDKIPNFLFTAVYGVIVYIFYQQGMAKEIATAMNEGASRGSNWIVAGVSVVGVVITLLMIVGLASQEPYFEGELMQVEGNELYYGENVQMGDVIKLRDELTSNGFFSSDNGNIVRLDLIGDEYSIMIAVDEEYWTDANVIAFFTSIKWKMEIEFGKPTNMSLESVSLTGNAKYKQITQ